MPGDSSNFGSVSESQTTTPYINESMSYKSWKNKVLMWQLATSCKKDQQAVVVSPVLLDKC